MVDYVETFVVGRVKYGIEDDPFNANRFQLWAGGCGIGGADTLPQARLALHQYILSRLTAEAGSYREQLQRAEQALERLGGDPFYLGRFLVEKENDND